MKILLVLSLAVGGALGVKLLCCDGICPLGGPEADAATTAPFGAYVEARNASVFGGACHYNGELTTQGQSAVLAWRLQGGAHAGVDLEGVELAAAVTATDNLKTDAPRRSIVYVDSKASDAQRDAAVKWVRETHAAALGEVLAVETLELDVASDGEHFRVQVGDTLAVCGSAMPDRECCKMPYNVWYEPFESVDSRLVAQTSKFTWDEARLAPKFERSGHNDAFLGNFGAPTERAACCAAPMACSAPSSRAAALTTCAKTTADVEGDEGDATQP
jgi:hypothetical protein